MAELNPNAITGLGSKLNTQEIIERFMKIEKRRLKPVEARKEQKLEELDAWNAVKMELQKLQSATEALDKGDVWEATKVDVSDPKVLEANARRDAEPGRTTLAVDSIALSHQLICQGYEREDVVIGTGKVHVNWAMGTDFKNVSKCFWFDGAQRMWRDAYGIIFRGFHYELGTFIVKPCEQV